MKVINFNNRFKEFFCVLFGHNWSEYGSERTIKGHILHEYNTCANCGLEVHNRRGYLTNPDSIFNK